MVNTLFFDIGGVILTNGWDHIARQKAAEHFGIDYAEMNAKHKLIFEMFETNKISLDQYLAEIIFYKKRNFSKEDFFNFMKEQSKAHRENLAILEKLSTKKKYLLAAINNESLELNRFRIGKYGLAKYFKVFFSSAYVGMRKPDKKIFTMAVNILNKKPGECFFVDDRIENVTAAKAAGLYALHIERFIQLESALKSMKIRF